jgi:hypothetical protein
MSSCASKNTPTSEAAAPAGDAHDHQQKSNAMLYKHLAKEDLAMMNTTTRVHAAALGAVALAALLGCSSTPTQESTGEYVDDTVITTRVKAALFNEPTLSSAEINVETFKGRVQLSGFVSSQDREQTAMSITRNVPGVLEVKDDMRLK